MAFYFRTVVIASLAGAITFAAATTLLERTLDLAEGTLPAAALSGLVLGTMVTAGLWLVFRLRQQSGRTASSSVDAGRRAVLAGTVAVPLAACSSLTVFTAWNENGPAMPEILDSLASLSIAGAVFYLLFLSTVHLAIGNTA